MSNIRNNVIKFSKLIFSKTFVENTGRKLSVYKHKKYLRALKEEIISYHKDSFDLEIKKIIDYLKVNSINVFPYNFIKKINELDVEVLYDESCMLNYIIFEGKRMYFKRSLSINSIKSLYKGLLIDQDKESPHLYLTETFNLCNEDVIADIGAAEGNFTLANIEKVKKAYIFEVDDEWIEALNETFKPWSEKVVIIKKFVTNYTSKDTIDFNEFYTNNLDISFIKIDIEGEEQNLIDACYQSFKIARKLKIALCTYHKHDDELNFKKQFKQLEYTVEESNGYMIFYYDKLEPPYLRRGLLRLTKP